MIELLAVAGWTLAFLLLGLWLGERGRRKDAQRREGVIRVDQPAPAKVKETAGSAATHDQGVAFESAREKYIEGAVAEGYSAKAAAEDWEKLMAQANVEQPSTWPAGG